MIKVTNFAAPSGELKAVLGNQPTIFSQGEGPINTIGKFALCNMLTFFKDYLDVGAFQGARAKLKLNLEQIGLIRQNKDSEYTVHNWNGDLSPCVHQYDRTKYSGYFEQEMVLLSASRRQFEAEGKVFPYP